jgi:glutamate decarboxylase
VIAENRHRNFIDRAEYPRTAEIERRCIRMLAALSLKWKWRQRRERAGKATDRPKLVRRREHDRGGRRARHDVHRAHG